MTYEQIVAENLKRAADNSALTAQRCQRTSRSRGQAPHPRPPSTFWYSLVTMDLGFRSAFIQFTKPRLIHFHSEDFGQT